MDNKNSVRVLICGDDKNKIYYYKVFKCEIDCPIDFEKSIYARKNPPPFIDDDGVFARYIDYHDCSSCKILAKNKHCVEYSGNIIHSYWRNLKVLTNEPLR